MAITDELEHGTVTITEPGFHQDHRRTVRKEGNSGETGDARLLEKGIHGFAVQHGERRLGCGSVAKSDLCEFDIGIAEVGASTWRLLQLGASDSKPVDDFVPVGNSERSLDRVRAWFERYDRRRIEEEAGVADRQTT